MEQSKSCETPFLPHKDGQDHGLPDYESSQIRQYQKRSWLSRHRNGVIFHGLMVTMYIMVTIVMVTSPGSTGKFLLFTPVHNHIDYTVKTIYDSPHDVSRSEFVGDSSPELDAAWYRLLRHHNLRIMGDELQAMNQTSIPLHHGGGYQGMMAVFHELHCLKLVREALHPDYYYKDKSELDKAVLAGHTEHCIDILREASMCRADTTIFPYHWVDGVRLPSPTWIQRHQCVDWNRLTEWLEERRVDIFAPNMLVHPKYGPAYPGGKRIAEPGGPQWYPLDEE